MIDPAQKAYQPAIRARRLIPGKAIALTIGQTPYVLFRDASGRARCLHDRCAHRFAPLSAGRITATGRIECGYHGWSYDGDGCGVAPGQPRIKRCNVASLQVVERGEWLWVGGADACGEFPRLGDDNFRFAGSFESTAHAPWHVVFDNFSEDEHTPFVHGRLGWTPEDVGDVEFTARRVDDHVEVEYAARQRPTVALPMIGVRRGDRFHNRWIARVLPLGIVYTLSWSDPRSAAKRPVELRYSIYFVPAGPKQTRIVVFTEVRVATRASALIEPIVGRVAMALCWKEVRDDARWVRNLGDTPESLRGMRLGRFDAPLVYQRKLIDKLYARNAGLPIAHRVGP